MLAPDDTMVAMLGCGGGCESVGVEKDAKTERGMAGARRGYGMGLPTAGCLGVCLFDTTTTTSGYEISARRVAIVEAIHVGVGLAPTVLRTSLVRSAT